MNSFFSKKLRKKFSVKYNISVEEIKLITESPFLFTANIIKNGDKETLKFKNIRILKFCSFVVKPGRLETLKKMNIKRKAKYGLISK